MKRIITKDEEMAYRMRHHNFAGLTTNETAKKMKFSVSKIRQLIRSLKKKAPNLFPIFTFRQHLIYWLYVEKGLTQPEIADCLCTHQSNVSAILCRLQKKGVVLPKHHGHRNDIKYEEKMDENIIIHKF